jgi:hypothetical protein
LIARAVISWLKARLRGAAERPPIVFDAERYLAQNVDVAKSGSDPYGHYLKFGAAEGRSPHVLFDTGWYLRQRTPPPGTNPLSDYTTTGWRLGASPHPLFHVAAYRRQTGTPAMCDLVHYLTIGIGVGLTPQPYFSPAHFGESLLGYLETGNPDDRAPHPEFDPLFYRQAYFGDRMDGDPLIDFVTSGWILGRKPSANPSPDWRQAAYRRLVLGEP